MGFPHRRLRWRGLGSWVSWRCTVALSGGLTRRDQGAKGLPVVNIATLRGAYSVRKLLEVRIETKCTRIATG